MRVKPKTIKLAKIRRLMRNAIHWYKVDDGMAESWTSENYIKARKCKAKYHNNCKCFYYVRSSKAIEAIAEQIHEAVKNDKQNKVDTEEESAVGSRAELRV